MRKISSKFIAITVFLVIFGGIGATILADIWITQSTKIPVTFQEGEFKGQYNPADIRGSYTFREVSDLFQVKLQDLYEAFGIPSDTDGSKIQTKALEDMYPDLPNEIGNGSVQLFVALYKGLPAELGSDTYLPEKAREILLRVNSNLTAEEKAYIDSHLQPLTAAPAESGNTIPGTAPSGGTGSSNPSKGTEAGETEPAVKGTTTFQQVLDLGISQAQIEEIIGGPMPPGNSIVKDYCLEKGLSFSEIKGKLNSLIEQ